MSYKSSINHFGVFRVGSYVTVLVTCRVRAPIVNIQRAKFSAARRRNRAAVLLRAINPVRKSSVGTDVIHLPSRLVVPGAPGFAAVARDDGPLIASQNHALRFIRIDP